jgi:hypothetical protein
MLWAVSVTQGSRPHITVTVTVCHYHWHSITTAAGPAGSRMRRRRVNQQAQQAIWGFLVKEKYIIYNTIKSQAVVVIIK